MSSLRELHGDYDGASRRDEVLDAAWAIATEKGIENISYSGIQNSSGIPRGTIYYHFPNMSNLIEGLLERAVAESHLPMLRYAAAINHHTWHSLSSAMSRKVLESMK